MFQKYRLRIIGLLLIVIVATVSSPVYSADVSIYTPRGPKEVHALLIISNDPLIAKALEKDSSKMQALLMTASLNCEVRMTVMESKSDATSTTVTEKRVSLNEVLDEQFSKYAGGIKADLITAWIRNLEPNANDTILVYFAGHGKITEPGAHVLIFGSMESKNMMDRKELSDLLSQKSCRLKILITDVDSSGPRVTEPLNPDDRKLYSDDRNTSGTSTSQKRNLIDAFKNLFLEHEGFLNLTAATEGEHAWGGVRAAGGIFTKELHNSIFFDNFDDSDLDGDGFLSWEEVFKLTRAKVMLWYDRFNIDRATLMQKGIESQRPKYYGELPKRIENKTAK